MLTLIKSHHQNILGVPFPVLIQKRIRNFEIERVNIYHAATRFINEFHVCSIEFHSLSFAGQFILSILS